MNWLDALDTIEDLEDAEFDAGLLPLVRPAGRPAASGAGGAGAFFYAFVRRSL